MVVIQDPVDEVVVGPAVPGRALDPVRAVRVHALPEHGEHVAVLAAVVDRRLSVQREAKATALLSGRIADQHLMAAQGPASAEDDPAPGRTPRPPPSFPPPPRTTTSGRPRPPPARKLIRPPAGAEK